MVVLNGIRYLPTQDYQYPGDTIGGQYGYYYTRQTCFHPNHTHLPVTIFTQQDPDQWFITHTRLRRYKSIIVPMTTNEDGVVVYGHMLPLTHWCGLALKDFKETRATNRGGTPTPVQWKSYIIPYVCVIFKGVLKSLTTLHEDGKVHRNLTSGIFVSVAQRTKNKGKAYMDRETLEGFLGNFQRQDPGHNASEGLKARDLSDLLQVILTILTFVNLGEEDLGSVKGCLEGGTTQAKRLRKFIIDLEGKDNSSTTSTGGYYYPFVWTKEEELAFLDMMHYVLFQVAGVYGWNKQNFDAAFEGIDAKWHEKIHSQDLVRVRDHQSSAAFPYVYARKICLIMFYRNGGEHVSFQPKRLYDKKIHMLDLMESELGMDVVTVVHASVYKFHHNGLKYIPEYDYYGNKVVDRVVEEMKSLLVERFCRR